MWTLDEKTYPVEEASHAAVTSGTVTGNGDAACGRRVVCCEDGVISGAPFSRSGQAVVGGPCGGVDQVVAGGVAQNLLRFSLGLRRNEVLCDICGCFMAEGSPAQSTRQG